MFNFFRSLSEFLFHLKDRNFEQLLTKDLLSNVIVSKKLRFGEKKRLCDFRSDQLMPNCQFGLLEAQWQCGEVADIAFWRIEFRSRKFITTTLLQVAYILDYMSDYTN